MGGRIRGKHPGMNMRGRIFLILRAMVMLLLIAARSDVGTAGGELAEMVLIPAGSFLMGATPEEQQTVLAFGWRGPMRNRIQLLVEHSGPQHTVHLDAFYIDKQEVT